MPDKLVSICIPAYENLNLLKRTLDSIVVQNYPAIEVIISDDSAGEDIKNALPEYTGKLQLKYFKNTPSLGTPANWNYVLDKAAGDLVMLVHHDDWFNEPGTILKYASAFDQFPGADFIFSRINIFDAKDPKTIAFHKKILDDLAAHPEGLLLGNVVGPPSNVMVRSTVSARYMESLIWLVDVEYYIRLIKSGHKFYFIDERLVLTGVHDQQVTAYVQQNKTIILKEHLLMAGKLGPAIFADWRIYDLYWRLLRNHEIRSLTQLEPIGVEIETIPSCLVQMLNFQRQIPVSILKNGVLSKALMFLSLKSQKKLSKLNRSFNLIF